MFRIFSETEETELGQFFFTLSFLQVNVKRRLSALFFHKFCIKCLGITAILIQSPSLAYEVME